MHCMCGSTYLLKIFNPLWLTFNFIMVAADEADLSGNTSSHFEWASMITSSIWLSMGPAKSMCSLLQGRSGKDQGCNGATGGKFLEAWQLTQQLAIASMSLSMLGHQTTIRALSFIRDIPWWESCSSSKIRCRPALGIMTRVHNHYKQKAHAGKRSRD